VLVNVPIVVGEANEPLELDSWAVYTLPIVKVPVEVNGRLKLDELPEQKGP
jgi:hypothetical protein